MIEMVLLITVTVLIVAGLLLIMFAVARALAVRSQEMRMQARVGALRASLEHYVDSGFQDVERMFVELRAADDPPQLDAALRAAGGDLESMDLEAVVRLRDLYERLGLVDHHIAAVREAPDWRSRADSALLLGQLGVVRAIPALAASVRDPDEDGSTVKAAAARALGLMMEPGTAEALVAELALPGAWSSPRIAGVLVALGDDSLPACLAGLDDANANVRAWCCRVLGRIENPAAVSPLLTRLLDRSGPVRTVAAEALGLLANAQATPALVEAMLRDPAAQVRAAAAKALGQIADPASFPALVDALDDPDSWTRIRALESLEAVQSDEPDLLLEVVRAERGESARAAVLALERLGHVKRWADELGEGRVAETEEWLVLVSRLGGSRPLRQTLTTSPELRARARAANLLGRARAPEALDDLVAACGDAEWPVRLERSSWCGRRAERSSERWRCSFVTTRLRTCAQAPSRCSAPGAVGWPTRSSGRCSTLSRTRPNRCGPRRPPRWAVSPRVRRPRPSSTPRSRRGRRCGRRSRECSRPGASMPCTTSSTRSWPPIARKPGWPSCGRWGRSEMSAACPCSSPRWTTRAPGFEPRPSEP